MDRIPVGKSIGGAYGFLFGRILTILGLSWLPAAIYAGARLAFLRHIGTAVAASVQAGHHPSWQVHLAMLLFFVFSLLMVAVIALPLNREALGMRDEPVLARFVIGARELKLLWAYIRIDVLAVALVVALFFAAVGARIGTEAALAAWAKDTALMQFPVVAIVHKAAAVIAVLIFLFVSFRLGFLIAPVTAAEDKGRLARAWELSRGSFWRMLAIFLAILVPLAIAILACEYAVLHAQLHDIAHAMFASGRHPDASVLVSVVAEHGPALAAIAAAAMVIASALFAGAGAAAYRALVPLAEPEEPAAEGPFETQTRLEPVIESEVEPAPAEEPAPHVEDAGTVEEAAPEEAAHDARAEPEPLHEAAPQIEAQPLELHETVVQQEAFVREQPAPVPPPDVAG
jgi:hypothetical protein